MSQKNPPYGFLKFFPKRLGIFNQFFTHLLHDHFYTRLQIFIQISPTLTKLCHTKRDHVKLYRILPPSEILHLIYKFIHHEGSPVHARIQIQIQKDR